MNPPCIDSSLPLFTLKTSLRLVAGLVFAATLQACAVVAVADAVIPV